jgi:hypothetical protein
MLPHHHEEYQQQMGHVWLGFSEKQIVKFLTAAGFEDARVRVLPVDPDAKGPALFAAIATMGLGTRALGLSAVPVPSPPSPVREGDN